MHKRIIVFFPLVGLVISVSGQNQTGRQSVVSNGKKVASIMDVVNCETYNNISLDRLYMVDSIQIFSKRMIIMSPIYIGVNNDGTCEFRPNWTVTTNQKNKKNVDVIFQSTNTGDLYMLSLKKRRNQIYIFRIILIWMRSSYDFDAGEKGVIPYAATQILHRDINVPINNSTLVFEDYFETDRSEFTSYFYPKSFSLKRFLKLMDKRQVLKEKDFKKID